MKPQTELYTHKDRKIFYIPIENIEPVDYIRMHDSVGNELMRPDYLMEIDEFEWHREGGLPAFSSSSSYSFHINNGQHRVNGPGYVYDGKTTAPNKVRTYKSDDYWYLYDNMIEAEEYFSWLEESGIDINNIGPAELLLIKLEYEDG